MAFSALPEAVRTAATLIWNYMNVGHMPAPADVIVALGSNDTRVADRAADLFLAGLAPRIIFSGGVGALTRGMYGGLSEAEYFAQVAQARGVPPSCIFVETKSTNTGENIRFTRDLLRDLNLYPVSVILVQKPFMERRTLATFIRQWPHPRPAFTVTSPQIPLEVYPNPSAHRLALADVLETMAGDLQRIAVYPARGFQEYQCIPPPVWEALRVLIAAGFAGEQLMRVDGAPAGSTDFRDYVGLADPPPAPPGPSASVERAEGATSSSG